MAKWKPEGFFRMWDRGTCLRLVAEENGQVVGIIKGMVVAELGMMLDPAFGIPSDRAEAGKLLMADAVKALQVMGVPEVHAPFMKCFRGLAKRLVRKFGFVMDTRVRVVKNLRAQ